MTPTCFQMFRIVAAHDADGNPGFRAIFVLGDRAKAGSLGKNKYASPWRRTRDDVRTSMLYLYADVQEFGKETLPQEGEPR